MMCLDYPTEDQPLHEAIISVNYRNKTNTFRSAATNFAFSVTRTEISSVQNAQQKVLKMLI